MRPRPEGSLSTSDQVTSHLFQPHQIDQMLTPSIGAYLPSTCDWAERKGALLPAVPSPGGTHQHYQHSTFHAMSADVRTNSYCQGVVETTTLAF